MPRVSNFRVKEIANTYAGNTVQSLALDLLDAQARIKELEAIAEVWNATWVVDRNEKAGLP